MSRWFRLWFLVALSAMTATGVRWAHPLLGAPAHQTGDPVIVAAGDISNCSNWEDEATAQLVDAIPEATVLALGDNVYEVGSIQEYNDCYNPTWGRFKARTRPVPGNHEYGAGNPTGYFTYFADVATPLEPGCVNECKGYYSYDIGAWHLIALNSEIDNSPGSDQEQWLRADLAAHPNVCTLAYWHRPRWSSGREGGAAGALIQALYEYGADVVLVGHEHNYERFAPQDPAGNLDQSRGIRQITVGTGGARLRDFRFIQPNSEVRNSETWGILKMTLHADSYDWEFIPITGKSFRDSGSAACVTVGSVPPPPAGATTTTVAAPAAAPAAAAAPATAPAAAAPVTVAPATLPAGADYTVQAGDTLSLIAGRYGLDWRQLAQINAIADPALIEVGQVIRLPGVQSLAATTTTATQPVTAAAVTAPQATTTANPAAPGAAGRYTVRTGDTLYSIAIRNGVTWQALATANGMDENDFLQVGQELIIPGGGNATVVTPANTTQTVASTTPLTPTTTTTNGAINQATASPVTPTTGTGRVHTVVSGDTIISIAVAYGVDWRQLLQLNGLTENSVIQVGQQIRIP